MYASDGRRIGIIGYITPVTKDVSNSEDMIFLDEIEAVTKVQTCSPGGKKPFTSSCKYLSREPAVERGGGGWSKSFRLTTTLFLS